MFGFLFFLIFFLSWVSLSSSFSFFSWSSIIYFFSFTLMNSFPLGPLLNTNFFFRACNNFSINSESFFLVLCFLTIMTYYGSKSFVFFFFFSSFPAKLISFIYITSSSCPFRCHLFFIPLHHWRQVSNSDINPKKLKLCSTDIKILISKTSFMTEEEDHNKTFEVS